LSALTEQHYVSRKGARQTTPEEGFDLLLFPALKLKRPVEANRVQFEPDQEMGIVKWQTFCDLGVAQDSKTMQEVRCAPR
jgi:hypothetical protein